jgi:hypothetical protein
MTVSPTFSRDASGAYLVTTPRGVAISPIALGGRDPDPCDGVGFYLYNGETLPPGISLTPADVSNPSCAPGFVYPATIAGTPMTEGTTTFTIRYPAQYAMGTFDGR